MIVVAGEQSDLVVDETIVDAHTRIGLAARQFADFDLVGTRGLPIRVYPLAVRTPVRGSFEQQVVGAGLGGEGALAAVRARMQPDGIHPSAEAQPRILDNVWQDLAPLLEAVGTSATVVFFSDHGEEFQESGPEFQIHGSGYSRWQLQVPLLLAWPGMAPAAMVLAIMILPTVAAISQDALFAVPEKVKEAV